jgi:hypothetical protein
MAAPDLVAPMNAVRYTEEYHEIDFVARPLRDGDFDAPLPDDSKPRKHFVLSDFLTLYKLVFEMTPTDHMTRITLHGKVDYGARAFQLDRTTSMMVMLRPSDVPPWWDLSFMKKCKLDVVDVVPQKRLAAKSIPDVGAPFIDWGLSLMCSANSMILFALILRPGFGIGAPVYTGNTYDRNTLIEWEAPVESTHLAHWPPVQYRPPVNAEFAPSQETKKKDVSQ